MKLNIENGEIIISKRHNSYNKVWNEYWKLHPDWEKIPYDLNGIVIIGHVSFGHYILTPIFKRIK